MAQKWLAFMGWEGSPQNAESSLATLLTSVRDAALEEGAQIADFVGGPEIATAIRARIAQQP